jgi:purine-cytosine permease-like protein
MTTFLMGFLGPITFNLSLGQSIGIIWGGGALGALIPAWAAIFGKRHGLRALVNGRYSFGYFGIMVMSALNFATEGFYVIMDCILGGQALNAISRHDLPVVAGIVIVGVLGLVLATAGFKWIHYYEVCDERAPKDSFVNLLTLSRE